jgi:carbon-monoxide dehydrogenase small subunit
METQIIRVTVNGERHEIAVRPNSTLLDLLREKLDLTGTKRGCDTGDCGACTVVMNGRPVNACLVLALKADGSDILTIEGFAKDGKLHPIQEAFIEKGAIQCGFCTPGMVLSAKALLDLKPKPTVEEIRNAVAGNLCRCTGYIKIFEAIQAASLKIE